MGNKNSEKICTKKQLKFILQRLLIN